MAYDKVIDSAKLETAITATADAIRAKTGSTEKIPWDADTGLSGAVESIATGIEPTGTINITKNGSYDVTEYASAEVAVPVGEKAKPTVQVEVAANKLFKGMIDIPVNIGVSVGVSAEHWQAYAYYNGVKLPRIPVSVARDYPYAWIRSNSDGTTYDLISSPYKWYYDKYLITQNSTYVWYTATAEASVWAYNKTSTSEGNFGIGRGLLWSNHDIPNGSADATDIYFAGSDPVPTD